MEHDPPGWFKVWLKGLERTRQMAQQPSSTTSLIVFGQAVSPLQAVVTAALGAILLYLLVS